MAPYNPEIKPTNDPSFGGTSRPIDIPDSIKPRGVETNTIMPEGVKQGDTSAEYAGKAEAAGMQAEGAGLAGMGDLFKNIAGVGDFLGKAGVAITKKTIEDKVYNIADRERTAYTDALEKIKSGVGVKNILTAGVEDGAPVPDDISNLDEHLSTLGSARDSGKISGTYYAGRLLAEAKNLRAQYPGFREEIDSAFSKATGVNPANAYIHGLVTDINKAASSSASDKNRTLTYIRNNLKYPNAEKVYQQYERGDMTNDDVMKWAAPYEQETFQLNQRSLKMNDTKLTREELATQAGSNLDYAAGVAVGRSVDNLLGKMGLNSAQDAVALDSKVKAGATNSQTWSTLGQQIADHKVMLRTAIIADADKTGVTKAIGKPEVIKRADAALSALDTLSDRVYNKDTGGLYNAAQYIKALQDDDTKDLLTNSKIGPIYRQVQVQKQIGGEQWMQKFQLDMISSDVPKKYQSYFNGWSSAITGQANPEQTVTFNDAIEEFKSKGVVNPKLNKALIGQIDRISDPATPDGIKVNVAKAAFDPANRGMISKLPVDGVDPATGRTVTGQNAIFQKFTSPEITKEMARLGQRDPKVWDNYLNWTKETLATELAPREIKALSQIPTTANVKVGWDSKNKMFVPVDTRSEEQVTAERIARGGLGNTGNTYFNQVQQTTNRLNANIGNFKRVAETAGMDVDAFVLRTIADAAGPEALRNVNGIPYNVMRDIGLANMKKKPQ
jgi:hypothetical protein